MRWLVAIFAVAILVRAAALVELSQVDPYFTTPVVDELTNYQDAIRIASGERQTRPFWKPPLYPHLLAVPLIPDPPTVGALYSEQGPSPWWPKGLQALLDACTAVLLVVLGTRVANAGVGRIAGLIYAFSFTPVYYVAQVLDTTLFTFLCVLMLVVLERARAKDDTVGWILGGVAIGIAATARAPALLFAPVAALAPWIGRPSMKESVTVRHCTLSSFAVFLGVVLTLMPVLLANWKFGGDAVLISSNGGVNFYIGNRLGGEPGADGLTSVNAGPRWRAVLEEADQLEKPSARSQHYYQVTLDQIAANPGAFAQRLGVKFVALFAAFETPNNKNFTEERARSWAYRLLPGRTAIVFALGIAGLLFARRRLNHRALIVGFVLTQAVGIIAFFVAARYRVPILAVMCIPAALYLEHLWRDGRRIADVGLSLVVLAALLTFGHVDWLNLEERFRDYVVDPLALAHAREQLAMREMNRAQRLFAASDSDGADAARERALEHNRRAVEYYDLALKLDPTYPEVHHNLAHRALDQARATDDPEVRAAQLNEAEALCRKALESSADWFEEGWNTLGQILLAKPNATQETVREAEAAFRRAIEVEPTYSRAHANLGQLQESVYLRAGDARASYELARRYAPDNPLYAILEARALAKIGRVDLAQEYLDRIATMELPADKRELYEDVRAKVTDLARQQSEQLQPPGTVDAGPDEVPPGDG